MPPTATSRERALALRLDVLSERITAVLDSEPADPADARARDARAEELLAEYERVHQQIDDLEDDQ